MRDVADVASGLKFSHVLRHVGELVSPTMTEQRQRIPISSASNSRTRCMAKFSQHWTGQVRSVTRVHGPLAIGTAARVARATPVAWGAVGALELLHRRRELWLTDHTVGRRASTQDRAEIISVLASGRVHTPPQTSKRADLSTIKLVGSSYLTSASGGIF